jgi:hypothetical protein
MTGTLTMDRTLIFAEGRLCGRLNKSARLDGTTVVVLDEMVCCRVGPGLSLNIWSKRLVPEPPFARVATFGVGVWLRQMDVSFSILLFLPQIGHMTWGT